MTTLKNIETDQGVNHLGQTFGYDHDRKNFITWDIVEGEIAVVAVEHDEQESDHGSIEETRRDAQAVATAENLLPDSRLRRAIGRRFSRD